MAPKKSATKPSIDKKSVTTYFLQQSPTTGRFYYTDAKWGKTALDVKGVVVEMDTVINGSTKQNTGHPTSIQCPLDFDPSTFDVDVSRTYFDGESLSLTMPARS